MDPITRRSLILYLTHFMTWCGILGFSVHVRQWPAFEIIPLFMPVWLVSSVVFTEREESYAFLRVLPVTDRRIVRTKFGLILGAGIVYWLFMVGAAVIRRDITLTLSSVLAYVTLVSVYGLVMGASLQMVFWRFGASVTTGAGMVFVVLSLVLAIAHMASLHSSPGWPVLSRTPAVEWLASTPWLSIPAIGVLALLAFYGLLQMGIRVKASSEACL